MNFLNLTENDCGQVNSLVEFSRHMVQDVARQDSIGDPSRASGLAQNNIMPPQSFRMHDLLKEMNTTEPQRTFIPAEHSTSLLNSHCTTEDHQYQEARDYNSFLPTTSYENVNMMYSTDHSPWNIGFPNPQVSLPFYSQHNFESQLNENLEYFDYQPKLVFEDSLDELDASCQCENHNKPPLENKIQQDVESEPVPQKYWKGIPIYDESVLSNLLETKTETYTYVSCLKDYGERCIGGQWIPKNSNQKSESEVIRDKLIPNAEEYPHIKINPVRGCDNPFTNAKQEFFKGNIEEAILYADEAARQNTEDINRWRFLQMIYQTELRYLESFFASKQILRLDPTHTLAHSMMTIAYLQDGCFYEAFETMVHWLKNHKSYGDIPLNFSMVENLSGLDGSSKTWIYSNQHIIDGVTNMLLTAARRNPTNADLDVQTFLSYIFSFKMDYDKSADCLTTIAHSKREDERSPSSCYNAGFNLFLCGKPYEALNDLLIGIESSENKVKDITYELIGIIYMYLTNYREAIRYFKEVLEIDPLDEEFSLPKRGHTLKDENELCLRLYAILYDRLN